MDHLYARIPLLMSRQQFGAPFFSGQRGSISTQPLPLNVQLDFYVQKAARVTIWWGWSFFKTSQPVASNMRSDILFKNILQSLRLAKLHLGIPGLQQHLWHPLLCSIPSCLSWSGKNQSQNQRRLPLRFFVLVIGANQIVKIDFIIQIIECFSSSFAKRYLKT